MVIDRVNLETKVRNDFMAAMRGYSASPLEYRNPLIMRAWDHATALGMEGETRLMFIATHLSNEYDALHRVAMRLSLKAPTQTQELEHGLGIKREKQGP